MLSKRLFLASVVLFVLLSLLFVGSVGASSGMWSQTYGGADQEVAYSLVEASDGGYALAGYTYSFGAGYADFWLVKTDNYGNMEWSRTYGGAGSDRAHSLVETSDGGYAIAGYTGSFGAGDSDFWLVKTDANGNMEWNQTYGGAESDCAYSLVEASDGGFALAGYTYSFGSGKDDFWLVKTDRYGNMKWNRTYGGEKFDGASSLVAASDGGYAIVGGKDRGICSGGDFWLIKTDAYGNMEWNRTYDLLWDHANSVVETSDGGYAITGTYGFFTYYSWFVKTNEYGHKEWDKNYGGLQNYTEYAYSVVETSDGGFALAGKTDSFGAGGFDFWLVKTDANGNMEWNQTYGGVESDIAYSLIETSDGGYAIAGYTGSFGAGDSDFWLVKTDEYGIIPEFPSWIILPLLIAATLAAIFYSKRVRARLRHF